MKIDPATIGHLRLDDDGLITQCDGRMSAILRMRRHDLIGCHVLKITAHADRDRCIAIFHQIRRDGLPVMTTKRIIRADRSHAWVRIAVTVPDWPDAGTVAMAVEECAAPDGWIEPSVLLALARGIFGARRARTMAFGGEMFGDHAWDLLLAAYITEVEGGVLTTADLHAILGVPLVVASRWMRALSADALVEYEDRGNPSLVTSSIRLTAAAHQKFERFLSDIHRDNGSWSGAADTAWKSHPQRDER